MIYLNIGRREVGKTTLGLYLIQKSQRRIVFDPRGLIPGAVRTSTPEGIETHCAQLARHGGELVITPDDDVAGCFDQTCREVKAWLRDGHTDIGFLIDETRFIAEDQMKTGALDWILRCATRQSVAVVFTAHRPSDVTTDVRSISDVWCIFQMTQEHDLKVVASRCSPSVAQKVALLKPRHFISWNDAKGQMNEHTHPERWYVPLRDVSLLPVRRDAIDELRGDDVPADPGLLDFSR